MRLSELQTGDVFQTRDGRRFIRSGVGIWKKGNVISLPNYVSGTMAPGVEVRRIGTMQICEQRSEMHEKMLEVATLNAQRLQETK